jgi:hypothetical protein
MSAPARSSRFTKTLTGIPEPVPHRARMSWSWVVDATVHPSRVVVLGYFDTQIIRYEVRSLEQAIAETYILNAGGWLTGDAS